MEMTATIAYACHSVDIILTLEPYKMKRYQNCRRINMFSVSKLHRISMKTNSPVRSPLKIEVLMIMIIPIFVSRFG
jgi:hypothetical protein